MFDTWWLQRRVWLVRLGQCYAVMKSYFRHLLPPYSYYKHVNRNVYNQLSNCVRIDHTAKKLSLHVAVWRYKLFVPLIHTAACSNNLTSTFWSDCANWYRTVTVCSSCVMAQQLSQEPTEIVSQSQTAADFSCESLGSPNLLTKWVTLSVPCVVSQVRPKFLILRKWIWLTRLGS